MKANPRRTCTPERVSRPAQEEDFIGDLSGMVDAPRSLHAQYNEAQAAPKSTPTWLSQPVQHTFFRKCAVAWTKWTRAHPSSSRPPACTYARTCDPHTLTSVCQRNGQSICTCGSLRSPSSRRLCVSSVPRTAIQMRHHFRMAGAMIHAV